MAKNRVQITLGFAAETNKAKNAIRDLDKQLNSFIQNTAAEPKLTKNLANAQEQAVKLTVALREAVNVDTGKFDLSKFQTSLKNSNTDLLTLRNSFVKAGPEGTKTFMALAQSIAAAEVPAKRINKHLQDMLVSLKNTAQWQISSSIVHGLTGAIQDAYSYAQDLNKSLNDIRIVTGYNTEHMEKFAVSANKAAKSLSTTTNEYTKASLIYFQQGLSEKEVEKRTATTIKMANVTGEAAEDVSSYMTAVWNNFDDGTKALEYYADAITALGAATASSSEEIATGLQKFAAVANTVGLSYEYATAALATVTSQTRESADTVGTAFKTIFARLESLSLGETLEDDTTMTKYSQALAAVGVNIKTANGELKDMDLIVDEVGSKWKNISKDQQIALAQTVAGMRQYNNFIALMDNYDTFKVNANMAKNSEGTLESQAEIYAESWEAASDRVRASAEAIYAKILDDDFFIDLLNGFEKLIKVLDKFIDSAGGLRGILFGLSSVLLKVFNDQAVKGLQDMTHNLKLFFGIAKQETIEYKKYAAKLVDDIENPTGEADSTAWDAEKAGIQQKIAAQLELSQASEKLTATQRAELQIQKDILDTIIDQSVELQKQVEASGNKKAAAASRLVRERKFDESVPKAQQLDFAKRDVEQFDKDLLEHQRFLGKDSREYANVVEELAKAYGVSAEAMWEYSDALTEHSANVEKSEKASIKAGKSIDKFSGSIKNAQATANKLNAQETIVKLASGLTGVVSALSMLSSTVATLSDPNVSGWDKFTTVLMTLGTIIPMVIQSFTTLKGVINQETIAKVASTLATVINTKARKDNAAAADAEEKEIKESAAATRTDTAEKIANKVVSKSGKQTGVTSDHVPINQEALFSNNGSAPQLPGKVDPKFASGAKGKLASGAGKAAASSGGVTIGAVIGMALAGIALIAGTIAITVKYFNKEAEALEKAKKNFANVSKSAEDTKNRYSELSSTIGSLTDKTKSLDEMTKGTLQWKEAVAEVNQEALDLIHNYDSLAGKYKIIDGVITFDEGALEELQEQQLASVSAAHRSQLVAQQAVLQAENEKATVDAQRNQLKASGVSRDDAVTTAAGVGIGAGVGLLGAAAIGAASGAALGPVGAAIGAAAGLVIGGVVAAATNDADEAEREALEKIADLSQEERDALFAVSSEDELAKKLEKLEITDPALIASLYENREEMKKLTDSIAANNELIKSQNAVMMSEYLGAKLTGENKKIYESSDYKDELAYLLANGQTAKDAVIAEQKAQATRDAWSLFDWDGDDEAVHEAYAEAMGWSVTKTENKTGKAVFHLADGTTTEEISDESMRAFLAAEKGREAAEKDLKKTEKLLNRIEQFGMSATMKTGALGRSVADNVGGAMASFLGGNEDKIRELNTRSLESLKGVLETANPENIISDEEAKANGYEGGAKEYVDAMLEAINESSEQWRINVSKLYSSLAESSVQAIVDSGNTELQKLSNSQILAYGQAIDKIASINAGAATDFNNMIQSLTQSYAGQADEIINLIGTIDWTDPAQGMLDLQAQLLEIGVVLSPEQLSLIKAMELNNTLYYNLDTVREKLQSIKEIIQSIEFGSIISDEDYKTLVKLNGELSNEFIKTVDGYRYIGSKSELEDWYKEQAKSNLQKGLEANATKRQMGADVGKMTYASGEIIDWSSLGSNGGDSSLENTKNIAAYMANDWDSSWLNAIGTSKEDLNELINTLNDEKTTEEAKEEAENRLRSIMDQVEATRIGAQNNAFNDVQEYSVYASTLTSFEELNTAMQKGLLGTGEMAEKIYNSQYEQIKKIETEIIKMDQQFSMEFLNWQLERLEDNAFNAASAVGLVSQQSSLTLENMDMHKQDIITLAGDKGMDTQNKDIQSVVSELLSGSVNLTEEEVQTLQTALSGLMSSIDELYEHNAQVAESVLSYFTDIQNEYNKVTDKVEAVTSLTSHYKDIVDIVGKGMLGVNNQFLKEMTEAEKTANTTQLQAAKATYERATADRDKLLAAYDSIDLNDEKAVAEWEASFAEINEIIDQSEQEMREGWTNALSSAAEVYKLELETVLEDFEASIAGAYGSLERLSEAFEQQSTLNHQYVSDYEKIYKLSKLTRSIEGSMNNASSIKAKSTLAELQREITALQESGQEMSEYDLEYLNKKYELKQAEIALEEAQNSKRTMRLTQDANGNWGYTYTANEDATNSAQQNYEDKLYALQEYNNSYLESSGSLLIQLQQEYVNAVNELYSDSSLTTEEIQSRMAELTEYYTERMNYAAGEYDKTIQNNLSLYTTDWTNYSAATGYKISDMEKFSTSFEDSILGTLGLAFGDGENPGSAQEMFEKFYNAIGTSGGEGLIGQLEGAASAYAESVNSIMEEAGTTLAGFKNDAVDSVTGAYGLLPTLTAAKTAFDNFIADLTEGELGETKFDKLLTGVKTWWSEFSPYITNAKNELNGLLSLYSAWLETKKDSVKNNSNTTVSSNAGVQTGPSSNAGVQTGSPSLGLLPGKGRGGNIIQQVDADGNVGFSRQGLPVNHASKDTQDTINTGVGKVEEEDIVPYSIGSKVKFNDDMGGNALLYVQTKNGYIDMYRGAQERLEIFGTETPTIIGEKAGFFLADGKTYATFYPVKGQYNGEEATYYIQQAQWDPATYDTGGYTGSWGPEGRLAMLHQKEIILNKDDTANFLAGIDILREIVKNIDLQAAAAGAGLGQFTARSIDSTAQTIQQEVTIHAEFPNATDRNEIEEAFNSLMTRTSQFVTTNK